MGESKLCFSFLKLKANSNLGIIPKIHSACSSCGMSSVFAVGSVPIFEKPRPTDELHLIVLGKGELHAKQNFLHSITAYSLF